MVLITSANNYYCIDKVLILKYTTAWRYSSAIKYEHFWAILFGMRQPLFVTFICFLIEY